MLPRVREIEESISPRIVQVGRVSRRGYVYKEIRCDPTMHGGIRLGDWAHSGHYCDTYIKIVSSDTARAEL